MLTALHLPQASVAPCQEVSPECTFPPMGKESSGWKFSSPALWTTRWELHSGLAKPLSNKMVIVSSYLSIIILKVVD